MPLDRPSFSSPRALGGTVVAGQTSLSLSSLACQTSHSLDIVRVSIIIMIVVQKRAGYSLVPRPTSAVRPFLIRKGAPPFLIKNGRTAEVGLLGYIIYGLGTRLGGV